MPNKIDEKIEKDIIDLYNDGYGTMEISQKCGVHRATVQRVLQRNNIDLRKRTPVHYDIHFFDEYNENSCYWAGFIAADGYVRSDRAAVTIHLASADYEHLLKLAKLTDDTVAVIPCSIVTVGEEVVTEVKSYSTAGLLDTL